MAKKKGQAQRAREPRTKTRERAELAERIDQWSKANGDDARAEALHQLLGRGPGPRKRKVARATA